MRARLRSWTWAAGGPARFLAVLPVRLYRLTVGQAVGGRCRFYPSCSAYAEAAITRCGVIRGVAFTVWRVLRCSPISAGGVDHPPRGHRAQYDTAIHGRVTA